MVYDVVVVGAGSNGLTAAYFIAKKGFKTLILERGRVAGEKCQGPTEFPAMGQFKSDPPLYDLMSSVLKEVPHIRNDWEVGTYIFYIDKNNKTRFKYYHDNPGEAREVYSVHEPAFLKVMADKVVDAGAELRTSTPVVDVIRKGNAIKGVVTDDGEKIEAKLTIAADGRISTVARKAGLLKKWNEKDWHYQYGEAWKFKSEEEMIEATEGARYHFMGPNVSPYTWMGATLRHRPMGIVTVNAPTAARLDTIRHNPRWYIRNLYRVKEVKKMLSKCEGFPNKPIQRYSTVFPHFGAPSLKKVCMDGLLVVGDAAGTVGVVMHGRQAAQVAIPALEAGDCSEKRFVKYQEMIDRFFKRVADRTSAMRAMFGFRGPGLVGDTDVKQMVENMRLAGPPVVYGAPNPKKVGGVEFLAFDEVVAWQIAIKINYLMTMYGPIMQKPEMLPKIIKWVHRNQESFNKKKVWDHPF